MWCARPARAVRCAASGDAPGCLRGSPCVPSACASSVFLGPRSSRLPCKRPAWLGAAARGLRCSRCSPRRRPAAPRACGARWALRARLTPAGRVADRRRLARAAAVAGAADAAHVRLVAGGRAAVHRHHPEAVAVGGHHPGHGALRARARTYPHLSGRAGPEARACAGHPHRHDRLGHADVVGARGGALRLPRHPPLHRHGAPARACRAVQCACLRSRQRAGGGPGAAARPACGPVRSPELPAPATWARPVGGVAQRASRARAPRRRTRSS